WNALDELHHEIGPARFSRATVENTGDVGMIHHRQRLPLGLKSGNDLPGIHPELDDLQRDHAAHGLFLLGHEDHAEAAFADLLEELVAADPRTWGFGGLPSWPRCRRGLFDLRRGLLEETGRLHMGG